MTTMHYSESEKQMMIEFLKANADVAIKPMNVKNAFSEAWVAHFTGKRLPALVIDEDGPELWLVLTHGNPDGTLMWANAVKRFITAHPDKCILVVCCYPAQAKMHNRDIASRILMDLWDDEVTSWIIDPYYFAMTCDTQQAADEFLEDIRYANA